MSKRHENFMDKSRLPYLSFGSGITPIPILVREIQRLQVGVPEQSTSWNSFGCDQFLPNLTSESEEVIYKKVVDNFIIFPTM
jgi:hypothetical protein